VDNFWLGFILADVPSDSQVVTWYNTKQNAQANLSTKEEKAGQDSRVSSQDGHRSRQEGNGFQTAKK